MSSLFERHEWTVYVPGSAGRRLAVIGEIAEETGMQAYRDIGQKAAFLDRILFVG